MSRILLVHWDPEDAAARSAGLRRAGFEVDVFDPKPDRQTSGVATDLEEPIARRRDA